jgi:hypothetical protein
LGFHPIGEADGSGPDVACGNGAAGSPRQDALPAGHGGFWHGPWPTISAKAYAVIARYCTTPGHGIKPPTRFISWTFAKSRLIFRMAAMLGEIATRTYEEVQKELHDDGHNAREPTTDR